MYTVSGEEKVRNYRKLRGAKDQRECRHSQLRLGVDVLEDVGELLEQHDVALRLHLAGHERLNGVELAGGQRHEDLIFDRHRDIGLGACLGSALVDIAGRRLEVHGLCASGLAVLEDLIYDDTVDLLELGLVVRQLLLDRVEEFGGENLGHG
ncbi:hypothetical protein PENTCL1PPCAC_7560, partial [Pristionchus entomophagus]